MITLAIDASTYTGTVAVLEGESVLAHRSTAMRGAEEERLMPAVAEALGQAGIGVAHLERVCCGAGPGSFTSLRIAASIAKGIATARDLPLVAVPSLALVVASAEATGAPGRYVAALDALREEHYVATCVVGADGMIESIGRVERWPTRELAARAADTGPLVGPGCAIEASPDAAALPRLAGWLARAEPVDLASWEPDYGRLAEAQVKWEAAHGRPLPAA